MKMKSLLPAALLLLLAAGPVAAQTVPLELEFGYRFLNLDGNMDEYRSQVNEREGLLLRRVTFATADFGGASGLADHLRLDGSELGIGPAGSLRLEFGRTRAYNLRFFYRRAEAFSALTDFANPFFPAVIPGQHTYSRVRNLYDAELEILPGAVVTPILGYTRNEYSGPGQTTYHFGQDEFRLSSDYHNRDEEYRLGAGFDVGFVNGKFIQGWRRFRENENLTLAPGEKNGNNTDPVLGRNITADSLNRTTETKTDTPSTFALVAGRIGPRVRLIGSYQRAHGEADTTEAENAAGSFASFAISRFFAGLSETASTKSNATFWTGSGRVELAVADGVDFSAGYSRRHRYMDGFALVSTLYTQTVTFAGADPKNLLVLLDANNAMDRFDNVFDTTLSIRALGPFSLRAGYTETKQDVTVTPDLSEIVISGNQGGEFGRRINTYTGGATFAIPGISFAVDYTGDRAGSAIVRTDFIDRDKYRFRMAWNSEPFLRVALNGQKTTASNDVPGVGYEAKVWEYGGELEFLPVKPLTLRVSASRYLAHSSIPIRQPADFSVLVSDHREDGFSLEGGVGLVLGRVRLDASYLRFKNDGSYPFTIDRGRASADIPVTAQFAFIGEWLRDKYNDIAQQTGSLGRYDANRYGLYVRWTP